MLVGGSTRKGAAAAAGNNGVNSCVERPTVCVPINYTFIPQRMTKSCFLAPAHPLSSSPPASFLLLRCVLMPSFCVVFAGYHFGFSTAFAKTRPLSTTYDAPECACGIHDTASALRFPPNRLTR